MLLNHYDWYHSDIWYHCGTLEKWMEMDGNRWKWMEFRARSHFPSGPRPSRPQNCAQTVPRGDDWTESFLHVPRERSSPAGWSRFCVDYPGHKLRNGSRWSRNNIINNRYNILELDSWIMLNITMWFELKHIHFELKWTFKPFNILKNVRGDIMSQNGPALAWSNSPLHIDQRSSRCGQAVVSWSAGHLEILEWASGYKSGIKCIEIIGNI